MFLQKYRRAQLQRRFAEEKLQRSKQDYFSALNDDCLYEIFEWLRPNDLSDLGETSKKFRDLVHSHANRQKLKTLLASPLQVRTIRGVVKLWPVVSQDDVIKRMEFIEIYSMNSDNFTTLKQFIQTNCIESVRSFKFNDCQFVRPFGEDIKRSLNKLENIEFSDCSATFDFIQDALQQCHRIKCFTLNSKLPNQLPAVNVPTLELFEYWIYDIKSAEMMSAFLLQNQQIQRVACRIRCSSDAREVAGCFKIISASIANYRDLFIELKCGFCFDIAWIEKDLKTLDKNKNRRRFGLKFDCPNIANFIKLTSLASLTELHLWNVCIFNLVNSSCEFKYLTKLYLCCAEMKNDSMVKLSKMVPNLEQLYLDDIKSSQCLQIVDVGDLMLPFVRGLPKLREIVVTETILNAARCSLERLNAERLRLAGACRLVFYVEEQVYGFLQDSITNYDALKRICVRLLTGQQFNYDSPFYRYTIKIV